MQEASLNARVLAALLLTMSASPAAQSACVGMGCDGPVRDASIICCNQLVYLPGKAGVGADRTVNCEDYLKNRASPETRRSICNQLAFNGLVCPATAACEPTNCGSNTPGQGFRYYSGAGGVRSGTSSDSTVVGQPPRGSRLMYTQTKRVNGQTYYYVQPPGGAAGWVGDSDVSCTRPGRLTPSSIRDGLKVNPSGYDPHIPQVASAQTAGSRG